MCQTNYYIDRFPDGREVPFAHLVLCPDGHAHKPCRRHETITNPVRRIGYHERTMEQLLSSTTSNPRYISSSAVSGSASASGPKRRHSVSPASSEGSRRRNSTLRNFLGIRKPPRSHQKERIIIAPNPPTPTTPPQLFAGTFTAPSSPQRRYSSIRESQRPIIVDERHMRPLGSSPPRRVQFETSPRSSHTSIDSRAEREDRERRRRSRDVDLDAELRRQRRIAEADEEIRRRPAIPIPSHPTYSSRPSYRPVVEQQQQPSSQDLADRLAGISLNDRRVDVLNDRNGNPIIVNAGEPRNRAREEKELRRKLEAAEAEAQKQRLRERQMPRRRFSVGPGHRRHRVLYDDGVWRWE